MTQLRMFASLREAAGQSLVQIQAATVKDLLEATRSRYGEEFCRLLEMSTVAVNGVLVDELDGEATALGDSDEVALLPPVSGGSGVASGGREQSPTANLLTATLFLMGVVVTSLPGSAALTGFVALVASGAAAAAFRCLTGPRSRPPMWLSGAAAAIFPLVVLFKSEGGLLWAFALAVLAVGGSMVATNAVQDPVRAAGLALWLALYFGFSLSFAVLIRQAQNGVRLLAALAVMILLYKLAVRLARVGFPQARRMAATSLTRPVMAAGLVASQAGAIIDLTFLRAPFTLLPMIVLGLVTGVAALLGDVASELVRSDLLGRAEGVGRAEGLDRTEGAGKLPILMSLDSLLFALPAFYYGFRLYVT